MQNRGCCKQNSNVRGDSFLKRKLYVDFDGTIVNSIGSICFWYNQDFSAYKKFKKVEPCDIHSYAFDELELKYPGYVEHLFNQPRFFQVLSFLENAKEVLSELSRDHEIIIVTKGDKPNLKLKKRWIKENMPFVSDFIGVNIKKYKDKSHINMSDGILIDDEYRNLITSKAYFRIMYGDIEEWNKDWGGLHGYNWYEIRAIIKSIEDGKNLENYRREGIS